MNPTHEITLIANPSKETPLEAAQRAIDEMAKTDPRMKGVKAKTLAVGQHKVTGEFALLVLLSDGSHMEMRIMDEIEVPSDPKDWN